MMAMSDANYRFLYADIGGYGSKGDAGYFGMSKFGQKILVDGLDLPEDTTING